MVGGPTTHNPRFLQTANAPPGRFVIRPCPLCLGVVQYRHLATETKTNKIIKK